MSKLCVADNRISFIDTAKGLGMILVVWGHIVSTGLLNQIIYSFHMPFFFFVSGYLLQLKQKELSYDFIRKGVKRLIAPYAVFSLMYLLFYEIPVNKEGLVEVGYMLYQTLCCRGMAPLWFLPSLFVAEVCYLAIKRLSMPLQTLILTMIAATNFFTYKIDITGISGLLSNPLIFCMRTSLCILFVYAGGYFQSFAKYLDFQQREDASMAVSVLSL